MAGRSLAYGVRKTKLADLIMPGRCDRRSRITSGCRATFVRKGYGFRRWLRSRRHGRFPARQQSGSISLLQVASHRL